MFPQFACLSGGSGVRRGGPRISPAPLGKTAIQEKWPRHQPPPQSSYGERKKNYTFFMLKRLKSFKHKEETILQKKRYRYWGGVNPHSYSLHNWIHSHFNWRGPFVLGAFCTPSQLCTEIKYNNYAFSQRYILCICVFSMIFIFIYLTIYILNVCW